MLTDWYFCVSLRLPAKHVSAYLDIVAVLEASDESSTLLHNALEELTQVHPSLLVHALPRVLAVHRRMARDGRIVAKVENLYDAVAETISGRSEEIRAALSAAGESTIILAAALDPLLTTASRSDTGTATSIEPYHDLFQHARETTILALLGELACRDRSAAARLCAAARRDQLTQDARAGRYGRLALLLAVVVTQAIDDDSDAELLGDLWRAGRGAVDLEPDLLHALCGIFLSSHTGLAAIAEVEAETVTGRWLLAWLEDQAPDPAWRVDATRAAAQGRLGGRGTPNPALPIVLWQAALWSHATSLNAPGTAEAVRRWWSIPQSLPAVNHREPHITLRLPFMEQGYWVTREMVGHLVKLRDGTPQPIRYLLAKGSARDCAETLASQVFSPWLFRADSRWNPRDSFPAITEHTRLMRVMTCSLIAVRLMRADDSPAPRDHLMALLFHASDVLRNRVLAKPLNQIWKDDRVTASEIPYPMLSLLWLAREEFSRAGRGNYPEIHPEHIAKFVTTGFGSSAPDDHHDPQWHNLFDEPAKQVVLNWIQDSAAGGTDPNRRDPGRRWFTGSRPALAVLRAVREDCDSVNSTTSTELRDFVGSLLADLYRAELHDRSAWDWRRDIERLSRETARKQRGGKPFEALLKADHVLNAPPYPVEAWAEIDERAQALLTGKADGKGTPVALMTTRLKALLERTELGDQDAYASWVRDWVDAISAINIARFLARRSRGRMVELLRSPVGSQPASQNRLIRVVTTVIDAIIEISEAAPRYHHELFRALESDLRLGETSATELQMYAIRAYVRQQGRFNGLRIVESPFTVLGRLSGAEYVETTFNRFLCQVGWRRLMVPEDSPAGPVIAAELDTLRCVPSYTRRCLPLRADRERSRTWSDERFVLASLLDHYGDQELVFGLDQVPHLAVSGSGPDERTVTSLFNHSNRTTSVIARLVRGRDLVLGVVCGREPDVGTGRRILVNCGVGKPIPVDVDISTAIPAEGQPLAVTARPGGGTEGVSLGSALWTLGRTKPQPDEVRLAVLTSKETFPFLSLDVEGEPRDQYPAGTEQADAEARLRWDPDLARRFAAQPDPANPIRTITRWDDQIRRWLPYDRPVGDLLVAELNFSDGVRAVVPLTFAGTVHRPEARDTPGARFVSTPGRSYVLWPHEWREQDRAELADRLADEPVGLVVRVTADGVTGRVRLADPASADTIWDTRTLDWLDVLAGDDGNDTIHVAHRDDTGAWCIDVRSVPGFPRRVAIDWRSTPADQDRQLCDVSSWGEPQARSGRIQASAIEDRGLDDARSPSRAAYDEHMDLKRRGTVVLTNIDVGDPEAGRHSAFTSGGLRVLVDTETVSLIGTPPERGSALRRRRHAQVTDDRRNPVPPTRMAMAIGIDQLAERLRPTQGGVDAEGFRRWLTEHNEVSGLIVSRSLRPGGPRSETVNYGAWLDLRDEVCYVDLPAECLDVPDRFAGEVLTGTRGDDGFRFSVSSRRIVVRALFEQRPRGDDDWIVVGRWTGGNRPMDVVQHPNKPVVAFRGAALGIRTGDDKAVVTRLSKGTWKSQGAEYVRAVVRTGNLHLVGNARAFPATAKMRFLGTSVSVETSPGTPSPFVDVGRELLLEGVVRETRRAAPTVSSRDKLERTWQAAIREQNEHFTGRFIDREFLLDGVEGQRPNGSFGSSLPLAEIEQTQQTLVGGTHYDPNATRIRVVPDELGFRASFTAVAPLGIDDLIAHHVPSGLADGQRHPFSPPLFYVGQEEHDGVRSHRFEWGYGWIVDIPAQRLRVGDRHAETGAGGLFHGDRVDAGAFDVIESGPEAATHLRIAPRDVVPGVQRQVFDEATAGVLHELEIRVDPNSARVRVLRVITAHGRVLISDDRRHARMVRLRGRLDEPSETALLALAQQWPDPHAPRRVLARLDHKTSQDSRGRRLEFAYVPTSDPDQGIQPRDFLYLEAGLVHEQPNDLFLDFHLPSGSCRVGEDITVRVSRRNYSHRHNALRRELTRLGGAPDAFAKGSTTMLVQLIERRSDGVWLGQTITAPSRPRAQLMSFLEQRDGSCLATVARNRRLEIRPGVLFDGVRVDGIDDVAERAIVQLCQQGTELVVAVAVPEDLHYVGPDGRAVVVLPKESARRRNPADTRGQFTLAGLPSAPVAGQQQAGDELLVQKHPKVALAFRRGRSVQLRLPDAEVRAAILAVDDPSVCPVAQPVPAVLHLPTAVPWARLSFRDGSAREVQCACREGGWRYHDQETGWMPRGSRGWRPQPLPEPMTATTEPVLFADHEGWTLRYEEAELLRYGQSAAELVDSADSPPRSAVYAVAGVDSGRLAGLWLETSPGRVVHMPGSLFEADTPAATPLARLDWSGFAVGDLVTVRAEPQPGEISRMRLLDWRPGLRSALGRQSPRLLLRVASADEGDGLLVLGSKPYVVRYPATSDVIAHYPVGSAVWLDRRNDLTPAAASPPVAGDTALLCLVPDRDDLCVDGLPHLSVVLAEPGDNNWPGASWLRGGLANGDRRRALLHRSGGSLPVTIEHVGSGSVTVSRSSQPSSEWPVPDTVSGTDAPQRIILSSVLTWLDDGFLLLRSGGALHRVPVESVVSGLPPSHAATVAQRLGEHGDLPLWWHDQPGRSRRSGLADWWPSSADGEIAVTLLSGVDNDSGRCVGLVCREVRTGALCWMPAREASWTGTLSSASLLDVLGGAPITVVPLEQDRGVSLTKRAAVERYRRSLHLGQSVPVAVCALPSWRDERGRYFQYAMIALTNVIVTLVVDPSFAEELPAGEHLLTEVADFRDGRDVAVVVVPVHTRRSPLDLPDWMSDSLERLTIVDPQEVVTAVPDLLPAEFGRYRRALQEGLLDGDTADDANEVIVRAVATAMEDPQDGGLRTALGAWLQAGGLRSLTRPKRPVHLAPLLAACLVCDALGGQDERLARGAVFLAHQIGRWSVRSLHVESLVRYWLGDPARHYSAGPWRRLRTVPMSRELTASDIRQMVQFATAMLGKPVLNNPERDIAKVAGSLLAACGHPGQIDKLCQDAVLLGPLSNLARSLCPANDHPVAQPKLLDTQRDLLVRTAYSAIGAGVALTLLPPRAPLPKVAEEFAMSTFRNLT